MIEIFHTVLYEPLLNLLVFFYNIIPGNDLGIAIILLTVVIKLILFPLSLKALKAQRYLQDLQPKIEELKKKYKDQKEILAQEMMKLYKEEKISPLSSCLPILLQLPVLWALYRVFIYGINSEHLEGIYSFIYNPGTLDTLSLGLIDLSAKSYTLAAIAAIIQFFQAKMLPSKRPETKTKSAKDEDMGAMINKQMIYMMPFMTFIFGMMFPAGLPLYWIVHTLITLVQQMYFLKNHKKLKAQEVKVEEQQVEKPKQLEEKK